MMLGDCIVVVDCDIVGVCDLFCIFGVWLCEGVIMWVEIGL